MSHNKFSNQLKHRYVLQIHVELDLHSRPRPVLWPSLDDCDGVDHRRDRDNSTCLGLRVLASQGQTRVFQDPSLAPANSDFHTVFISLPWRRDVTAVGVEQQHQEEM